MDDPVTEVAKATQEVAKATSEGIGATRQLGTFVARLIAEPVDSVVGILTDRLKYIRWERQIRLAERAREFLAEKELKGNWKPEPVPPKLALPILENATLEEDDTLQDMWARLLVSASDPSVKVRSAFVELIRQMEPVDARILEYVYEEAIKRWEKHMDSLSKKVGTTGALKPSDFGVALGPSVRNKFSNLDGDSLVALDNLMRLRCLRSEVEEEDIFVVDGHQEEQSFEVSRDQGYWSVCITPLGLRFIEACGQAANPSLHRTTSTLRAPVAR